MDGIDHITGSTASMASFLRQLAQKIDDGQLDSKQLFRVGEFIIAFTRQIALETNKEYDDSLVVDSPINDNHSIQSEEMEEGETGEDLKKFIVMGWYIYQILKDVEFAE